MSVTNSDSGCLVDISSAFLDPDERRCFCSDTCDCSSTRNVHSLTMTVKNPKKIETRAAAPDYCLQLQRIPFILRLFCRHDNVTIAVRRLHFSTVAPIGAMMGIKVSGFLATEEGKISTRVRISDDSYLRDVVIVKFPFSSMGDGALVVKVTLQSERSWLEGKACNNQLLMPPLDQHSMVDNLVACYVTNKSSQNLKTITVGKGPDATIFQIDPASVRDLAPTLFEIVENNATLVLDNRDPTFFRAFIAYCLTGVEPKELLSTRAHDMLKFADWVGCSRLKLLAQNQLSLMEVTHIKAALNHLILAEEMNCGSLYVTCLNFLACNGVLDCAKKSPDWDTFTSKAGKETILALLESKLGCKKRREKRLLDAQAELSSGKKQRRES